MKAQEADGPSFPANCVRYGRGEKQIPDGSGRFSLSVSAHTQKKNMYIMYSASPVRGGNFDRRSSTRSGVESVGRANSRDLAPALLFAPAAHCFSWPGPLVLALALFSAAAATSFVFSRRLITTASPNRARIISRVGVDRRAIAGPGIAYLSITRPKVCFRDHGIAL